MLLQARVAEVELAALKWVDRFNAGRLLGPTGNIPPAATEEICSAQTKAFEMVA